MVNGVPVFAVKSDQLTEVTAGLLASHRFNAEAPAGDHLAYTSHTLAICQILKNIIQDSFSESRLREVTLLDVGGGRGEVAGFFSDTFDSAMIDVDLFSARVALALQEGASRFHVFCGDCACLPIESHSVDVLIVKETAHHMADTESFFAEIARVVRLDGIVLIVERLESVLLNRQRALANDRMRQLGATHHHFLLRDLTRPLRKVFADTRVAHAGSTLFRKAFAKVGLPRIGRWIDRLLARLPVMLSFGATLAGGGTIVLTCRRPVVGKPLVGPVGSRAELVNYPIELADVEPMSEAVIKNIRDKQLELS